MAAKQKIKCCDKEVRTQKAAKESGCHWLKAPAAAGAQDTTFEHLPTPTPVG